MGKCALASLLLLALPGTAQQEIRKPSPFPEKNRGRRTAAASAARTSEAALAAPANTGTACFFSPRPGIGASSGATEAPADQLVAVHASYAPGARLTVTNLANGKSVEVTVTGRFTDARRIISVSEAAAVRLGFRRAGTAEVRVDPTPAAAAPDGR